MRETRYVKAVNEALHEEMARDEKVVAITAAMPSGTGIASSKM